MDEESLATDCILLIMNCQKYALKAESQKNTWLRDMNYLPFFHVIGDPALHYDYEFRDETNKLIVCVDDDYQSLPKKVIRAYEAIRKHFPSIKYIFKTDDDQILQPENANKFFETIRKMLFRSIEQNEKSNTMEPFYKILDLVFKFDLRDNPNGGTYSLLEAGYLKLIQDN